MLFDESWIERLFLQLRQSNSLSFHIKHYNFNRIPAKKAFTLLQTQLHYSVHSSFVIPHKRAASLALDRHVVLWLWKKYVKKNKNPRTTWGLIYPNQVKEMMALMILEVMFCCTQKNILSITLSDYSLTSYNFNHYNTNTI